jgi:hypothetical protein
MEKAISLLNSSKHRPGPIANSQFEASQHLDMQKADKRNFLHIAFGSSLSIKANAYQMYLYLSGC